MRRAFDTAEAVQRIKICAHCGTPFGIGNRKKPNFLKAKFCTHACSFEYTRAQGPARFWEKVKKTATCWLYTGFRKWDGYGWVSRSGRCMTAHRYAWTLLRGPVPAGMHLLHNCDVPACCNPDHIRLGTHEENMADMKAKGRQNSPGMKKPVLHPDRIRPRRAA